MSAANDLTFQYHDGTKWTSQTEGGTTVTFKYSPSFGYQLGGSSDKLAFLGSTPVVKQVLATGAGKTVDEVITLLQTLGLCKQS